MRDTIARQLDVDKGSIRYEVEPGTKSYRNGTITFSARKGKSIDLQKLQESLAATRLGKRTSSGVNFFDLTAEGEVVLVEKEVVLKVSGTGQLFTLDDDPKARPKEGTKTAYQRLEEALARGEKVVSVTGRVRGWSGRWPGVLKDLAEKAVRDKEASNKGVAPTPTLLVVTDFQTARK